MALMLAAAPAAAQDLEANKKLVLDFWRVVLEAQNVAAAKDYLAEGYVQHNPLVETGLAGFEKYFGAKWRTPKAPAAELREKPVEVLAENDLVTLLWKVPRPEPADASKTYDSFWFDTFRVKDGKLVEHWDCALKK